MLYAALFFGGFMKQYAQRGQAMRNVPRVNARLCVGCGNCAKVCFRRAISFAEGDKADIVQQRCVGIESCGHCIGVCDNNAIEGKETAT
jgi:MinD superfamily P-loop ATPase